jgi:hypothetical protein
VGFAVSQEAVPYRPARQQKPSLKLFRDDVNQLALDVKLFDNLLAGNR